MRPLHVGHDESLGAGDRTVDVRLGGEVHDRLAAGHGLRHSDRILDRAMHEADLRLDVEQVLAPARVGQLVEHRHLVAVLAHAQAHERRADETGTTADQQPHLAATPAARYSARPSRQWGSRGTFRLSLRRTLYAGRGAGRGNSSVVVGATSIARPALATISRANSYHEHSPPPARWRIASGRVVASSVSAPARCPVNVGQPTWSSTTLSSSRSRASRMIVAGKHGPAIPNSHDERTIVCVPGAWRATSTSPASFVRPYAESGPTGSDSRYGSRLEPSNT